MPTIRFVADYHFGDEWVSRYENRIIDPYDSAEFIKRFNNIVKSNDITYFAGDIATKEFIESGTLSVILSAMNGYKILILGNHDREISIDPKFWMEQGFDEVSTNPIVVEDFFIVSHEPMYMSNNMPYVNIFGHVHANDIYKT